MLTETMGGEITLRSTPRKGSTFRIRLFLPEVANPRALPAVHDRVIGYLGPRRAILIADDEPMHRDLLAELLAPLGFAVVAAATGTECLARAEEQAPI